MEFPWNPDISDPRKLHNNYVRNLITCYISKYSELSEAIKYSIDSQNYLVYALSGRALIEITSTLRYYVFTQYKPLFDKGSFSKDDFKKLIDIDDRHLRGGRFDWNSFIFKQYKKLQEEALKQLQSKKKKQKYIAEHIIQDQVNVMTCVEKWAEKSPEILFIYNLFCDLVHPNIGSSFLVASTNSSGLHFSKYRGDRVALPIFEQSFPLLLSSTHKPFGDFLVMLMATVWQDDELK